MPLSPPERGYPFLALAVLLVVVASPVVSLGGTQPLLLGLAIAALTVCFLWLERLPLRPGLGVAALGAIALAGALPLAVGGRPRRGRGSTTRRSPRGSGPTTRCASTGAQQLRADRLAARRQRGDARQVRPSRTTGRRATSSVFDGVAWDVRSDPTPTLRQRRPSWEADLPRGLPRPAGLARTRSRSAIRRMRTANVIGAGTILKVEDAARDRPSRGAPGHVGLGRRAAARRLLHARGLRAATRSRSSSRGPPTGARLREPRRAEPDAAAPAGTAGCRARASTRACARAVAHFAVYGRSSARRSTFPGTRARRIATTSTRSMQRSSYARTWRLSKRLKRGPRRRTSTSRTSTRYLHGPEFHYYEHPPPTPPDRTPLDYFIYDTTPATASTSRARWRCCCGWAACPRAWPPASAPAATPSAARPGSCATPTRTRGSRCGSTRSAGSRSTRRPTRRPRARRSPR